VAGVSPGAALWFTNGTHAMGEITPAGAVTILSGRGVSGPAGITADRFNFVWFTDSGSDMMSMVARAVG
jgi:streptogramin lyase